MPASVDDILSKIVAALYHLRPPDWTKHNDFSNRPSTWWLDEMHPEWIAEEYLAFLSPNPAPSTGAERKRVKKIGGGARKLAKLMKYRIPSEFVVRFHAIRSDHPLDQKMPTFAIVERALERLADAADLIEFDEAYTPRELAVARLAASHFSRITWRLPGVTTDKIDGKSKASGPYFDFVKAVFVALGITESAERNAKKAAADFKKPKPEPQTFKERYTDAGRILIMDADERKQPK